MPFRAYMDTAWARGVAVLEATPAEVERGCALHRELPVCDGYGFVPRAPAETLPAALAALAEEERGLLEQKRRTWRYRITSAMWSAPARAEFEEALLRAGLCTLVQPVNDVGEALEDAVQLMGAYRHLCHEFPGHLAQVADSRGILAAKKAGQTGLIFSLTGLPYFGTGSLADPDALFDWVDTWRLHGVRFMHVGYNRRNPFADGCMEARDGGLSELGRELVGRLNRAGIVVDLPHSSPQTTLDAVAVTSRPLYATHTGCRALFDHPRCKSDAELKAIASTGGVIGIYALPAFLGPRADLKTFLAHIAHAVKTVGAEHVAIGTDIAHSRPGGPPPPSARMPAFMMRAAGFHPAHLGVESKEHHGGSLSWTNWPLFTTGLLKLGLSEEAVEKIVGGNLRRVLDAHATLPPTLPEGSRGCGQGSGDLR